MIGTAVGRDDISSVPVSENAISFNDQLPDLSLCNTQWSLSVNSLSFKRVQGDKDLLLLHAGKLSKTVKVISGDHLRSADSLTHIYLFLFPYHFFW